MNYNLEMKKNWNNKANRSKKAKEHTFNMAEKYSDKISDCIANTKVYDDDVASYLLPNIPKNTNISVEAIDSVEAIMKYAKNIPSNIAVLNFASYKHPGGMFMEGSIAQEEALCHESFLYNVLSECPSYYDYNKRYLNRALYKNRALYSPDIVFERDNTSVYCDVITCAAPNKTVAKKYQNVSDEENTKVLRSRIDFILKIAADNKTDILILGAFGSGVFGQSAKEVASIFKDLLENKFSNIFDKIVFAVPSGNGNLEAFQEIFG